MVSFLKIPKVVIQQETASESYFGAQFSLLPASAIHAILTMMTQLMEQVAQHLS
jgi:hypothetical protein